MERKEAIRREGVIDRVKATSLRAPDGVRCLWVKEIMRSIFTRLRLLSRFGQLPLRPSAGFVFRFKKDPPPHANDEVQAVAKAEAAGVICSTELGFAAACINTH